MDGEYTSGLHEMRTLSHPHTVLHDILKYTVQYSTVQYSTVQYSTARHGTAPHRTAPHHTARHMHIWSNSPSGFPVTWNLLLQPGLTHLHMSITSCHMSVASRSLIILSRWSITCVMAFPSWCLSLHLPSCTLRARWNTSIFWSLLTVGPVFWIVFIIPSFHSWSPSFSPVILLCSTWCESFWSWTVVLCCFVVWLLVLSGFRQLGFCCRWIGLSTTLHCRSVATVVYLSIHCEMRLVYS